MSRRPAAALILAASLLCPGKAARAEVLEEVAALVNGQTVTRGELLDREAQVRAQIARQFSGEDLELKVAEARRSVLTDMIREILLLQRAEILGLDLDKVYKSALDNLKEQQGIKTNDEMNALLKQEGISADELRQVLLRYNVPDIMVNLEVRQKLIIPPDEVKAYFDKHQEEFRVEETFKLREVVLLAEGHTDPQLDELSAKIQAEMAGGLPFPELVLKYSEAPSRFQEGIVGPMKAQDLAKELRAAVITLKPDEVAGPIRLAHGVHFVQLVVKSEAQEPNFDAVKTGIENKLKQEKFAGALDDYWQRLFKENRITIKEGYRSFAEGIPAS